MSASADSNASAQAPATNPTVAPTAAASVLIPAAAGVAEVADTFPATTDAEMEEAEIADNDDSAGAAHGQVSGQTLEHGWAFWLVSPQVEAGGKVASERTVHTFSTVDEFWSLYNNILHPSKLGVGADLYCLKNKIEPKLEDPICANGGKWAISCGKGKSDKFWVHTLLPLIGGRFEYGDEICGAVLSVRGTQDMIAVWTKYSANEPAQSADKGWVSGVVVNRGWEVTCMT
ncbi:eukaryotic translation initiation factor 4E-1-like [Lolium rigidum]|uniref:eukaryotic translation initiation factor 4E-1-like n=1 Tax=Lolium rigidum TaxID=89674 RepID=UPI001F5D5F16|nr:eukaryotic translation initiation factor 4E-1-like [Lolium rigidum]